MITDAWEGIGLFLEPGTEVLLAADGSEVMRALEGLTPARARQIGAAAKARVLAEHTYAHRVLQLERVLGSAGSEALSA